MPNLARILLPAALLASLLQAAPVRVLIITGETDLPYHDWRQTTPFLREALARTGRFDVKVTEEPRGLNASALADYDVLVLNYNGPRWGAEAERAVESFVRSGKGMIAFHGVSYGTFYGQVFEKRWTKPTGSGPGWTAYADMMGVTWKPENLSHSVRHVFPVKWTDPGHPIARGLDPTFLANDELYHKMDHKPNIHVIAAAFSDPRMGGTGKEEPIIWTVPFGKGRVVHMTLGHDLSALAQSGVVTAFARGTEWAATGEVTLSGTVVPYLEPAKDAVRVLVLTAGHAYPTSFYTLFEGYGDIRWSHAQGIRPDLNDRFDVLVLHDMRETIPEAERTALQAFVDAGKGVVSIHHSIVDYTSWPFWYEEVTGGKFFTAAVPGHPKSAYHEGVEIVTRPAKGMNRHPVLAGVGPIVARDEAYRGMWLSPKITALMETDHPENDPPVVYAGPHPKCRAVYIQLGHDTEAFRHPGYRRLVHNAILWTAGRTN